MRYCLKVEFYRLRQSKSLWLTLALGIIIVGIDMLQNFRLQQSFRTIFGGLSVHVGYENLNLFNRWIGANLDTTGYAWFFFIFPLLAVIPYSWSYDADLKSGFWKQIMPRTGRANYIVSKTISSFVSGGLVIGIPLLINLLGSAMFLPAAVPDVTSMQTPVWSGYLFSKLFYSHPWIFSFSVIIIDMLWGGTIAMIALAVSSITYNRIISLITPFLLFLLEDYIALNYLLSENSSADQVIWSPLALLHPVTVNPNPAYVVFSVMLIHLFISCIIIFFKGLRCEYV